MGTYHPDPFGVIVGNIGRELEDRGETYESYTGQLVDGEDLWLATNIGPRPLVILLDRADEFVYVTTHRDGKGAYVFYAIPRA